MAYTTTDLTNLNALKKLAAKLSSQIVETGGEPNVIDSVKVNGTALTVDSDKAVDITVPTAVSDLTNDSKYQTESEVSTTVQSAISASGHAHFETADAVPTADEAEENVLYLVKNADTGYYDIYALVSGSVVRIDDTTVDLTAYAKSADVTSEIATATSDKISLTNLSASSTGTGNAVTGVTYDSTTGATTVTLGETFVKTSEIATDDEVDEMLTEVFGA